MANIKRSGLWAALITLLLLGGCKGEEDNMLFQAENYCLFSAMEGTLTFQGKPAAGAKVVRHVNVNEEKGEPDFVIADDQGRFALSTVNRKIRRVLPVEIVAFQDIFVHYQGQEYAVWIMSKHDKGETYGELGGVPVNFRCELTDELVSVDAKGGLLGTSCVWDSIREELVK